MPSNVALRHIQLLTGTTITLESSTYILLEGQPCYNLETKEFKIGDGTKTWSELDSISVTTIPTDTGLVVSSVYEKTFGVDNDVTEIIKDNDSITIETSKYTIINSNYDDIEGKTFFTTNSDIDLPFSHIGKNIYINKSSFSVDTSNLVTKEELDSAVSDINTHITNINTRLDSIDTTLTNINTNITNINTEITSIQLDIEEINDSFDPGVIS